MYVRKKTLYDCRCDQRRQKAVAIALYIKQCLGRDSTLKDFTFNKLHKLTGISPTTLRKYMPILIDNGWVTFSGKRNQHLVANRISSKTDNRNASIDCSQATSFKEILTLLRARIVLMIQERKDYIKRTIQAASNPSNYKEGKEARSILKRLVRNGVVASMFSCYRELGISLKRIAEEIGVCVKTAQKIIGKAIEKKVLVREHHSERVFSPNHLIEGYTFYHNGYSYLVHANTYASPLA